MPTTNTRTVKSSGGDYTSLSAWEAGRQANLVSGDIIEVAECYSFEDTTPVTIDGWTTDATRYISILTPAGERHDGEWNTGKYRLVCNTDNCILVVASNVFFEGLQVRMNNPADFSTHRSFRVSAVGNINIDRCILYGDANAGGKNYVGVGFEPFGALGTIKIQNCGFFSTGTGGSTVTGIADGSSSAGTVYIYNNTFKSFKLGVSRGATAAFHLINCGFVDCTTRSSGTLASDTTNSTSTPTFDTGKEFHLASGDSTWKDQGTDLSADGGSINSLDLDGETRSGTWDIGADEYVAGGGGSQVKTISGLAIASVKTVQGLAIASNKTILGVTNV